MSKNLISQQLVSFKGGVSQQPVIIRYPDQVAEQVNGIATDVEGLHKRPPTVHIKRLMNQISSANNKFHVINRDKDEQYIVKLNNNREIDIWDLQGNKKEVKYPEGNAYLDTKGLTPDEAFSCTTVADYTFILNRTVKTKMLADKSAKGIPHTSLAYVKGAQYNRCFAVYIDNKFAVAYRTRQGDTPDDASTTSTSYIADKLIKLAKGESAKYTTYEELNAKDHEGTAKNPSFNFSAYEWSIVGDSTISIRDRGNSKRPDIMLKDGFGGQNFIAIKGSVTNSTKLPPAAPNGYKINIKGLTNGKDDDYWVEWIEESGIWKECIAPDLEYKIDPETMPWGLVREADGSFSFKKLKWIDRVAGDDNSNPEPSFIGNTINDVFFYRNRLGFISGESISLSATSDFYNFWYASAVTIIDTDPIDVSVSSNKVVNLTHAVPFARELMLFSREGQFVLSSDGVMTPKSVKVDQLTSFNYSSDCEPLGVGQSIFFINKRVNYCSLMRYYTVQDVAEMKDAEDTSAHVPRYIPNGIRKISGNTTYETILCLSETDPEYVWTYKYMLQNGQSVQQSWSKWYFGEGVEVVLTEYVDAYIYLLLNTGSGLYLDRMLLTGLDTDFDDEPYRYLMDSKVKYTIPEDAEYDEYNNRTKISFKDIYGANITLNGNTYWVSDTEGCVVKISKEDVNPEDSSFWLNEDVRNKVFFIGRSYKFHVVLSPLSIKIPAGNTVISEDEGRLQLRYFWFNYESSGPMTTTVFDVTRKQVYKYVSTNKNLGLSNFRLGRNMIIGDKFKFPIQRRPKDILISFESELPTPLNIISGGWEGYYVRRNRKV